MDHYLTSLALIAVGFGLLGFVLGVFAGNKHGQAVGAESERRRIKRHHMEVMLEQVRVDGGWTAQSRYWYRRLVKPLRLDGLEHLDMNDQGWAPQVAVPEYRRDEDA